MSQSPKLYAERDPIAQGEYYLRHVNAMTAEGLHSKADIASELAHRDIEIDRLRALAHDTNGIVQKIARDVALHIAEIPDRNSPDDQPNMMLVTPEEVVRAVTVACERRLSAPAGGSQAGNKNGFIVVQNQSGVEIGRYPVRPMPPAIPYTRRATGRTIPDLTGMEHVCEWQRSVAPATIPDLAAMEEENRALRFLVQDCWPYLHQWCTIESVKNKALKALRGLPISGRAEE